MPAGIVIKTPNSGRAKNANNANNNNNGNNNNNNNNGSSGKKFVQTRLPFKLITPVAATSGAASASGAATATPSASTTAAAVISIDLSDLPDVEREPRKRKLSYGLDKESDAEAADVSLRRSNSKENLLTPTTTQSKKPKTADTEDCIELIDDDDDADEETADDNLLQQKSKSKPKSKLRVKAKEKVVESAAPVQIKLPLNNKRAKRRKSLKKSDSVEQTPPAPPTSVPVERSDSSDDIEAIAEQLNPQKRPKVQQEQENKVESKEQPKESQMDVDTDEPLAESDSEPKAAKEPANVVTELSSTDADMEQETETDKEKEQEEKSSADAPAAKPQQLTAKQLRLMEQRRKAREEKERKLQEERTLKQQEKDQREQLKKAEREQKEEQRRKEREDKEQVKRQEREEKERKRQAEVDKKDEEKRKRNEAKEEVQRKKDEERRRKELEKEEAELKKKRAAASFTKFFVPKQPRQSTGNSLDHDQNSCDSGPSNGHSQTLAFRPFQIKDDMIMAPVIRASIGKETRRQLDRLFHRDSEPNDGDDDEDEELNESIGRVKRPTRAQLYIGELSQGRHKPLCSKRDVRLQRRAKDDEDEDDVQIVDELANAGTPIVEERAKQLPWVRAKYLHFADNRRPPFYGTWRKRSQQINARRPLGQDKTYFDYEVDSDCEWEEEEPGESLSASEDEKERESEEESEEEYNEWFVPHGHLSDEELQNDDELEDGNTREAQKAKLQVLQQEFAQEMKKQTKKIKPRLLGPVWLDENGNKSELFPAVFTQTIDMYGCWQLAPLTLEPPPETVREEEPLEAAKPAKTVLQLDEPLLQQLVRLIHGNSHAKAFLISEYLEYLKTQITQEATTLPSKTLLREKFDELASWKPVMRGTNTSETATKAKKPKKRLCWVVSGEMLQKYQLPELTLQNQWSYTLTPKASKVDTSLHEPTSAAEANDTPKTDLSKKTKRNESLPSTPNTTAAEGAATASPTTAAPTVAPGGKKRATLLMSVGRDQQFHTPTKNALISQYLRKQNGAESKSAETKKPSRAPPAPSSATNSDEVVLLSD
ncbi:hypothetical protein KR093_011572 [Drosophila rubida]|uniref:Chromatin assembly factor 1 subunit A n=1 Tax=Drosophila rubida TaxID=30044 RepID=A0AAD4PT19_9MUSC|nr:hypothetical protein KR093_011572 [Drosophila rubida]